jgi:plastocyanin domain-containing protein
MRIPLLTTLLGACLGLFPAACSKPAGNAPAKGSAGAIRVIVDASGYQPAEVRAPAGKPVRLEFLRTSDDGCGQQLVFPTLDIRRDLPLNEVVPVDITMPASGSLSFTCGMDMYRGAVIAQ